MSAAPLLIRGAPRYVHGPAGTLSLIPEIRVDPDGGVRPAALLVIRPAGVERHVIGAAGRGSGGPVQTAPRHPPVPPEPLPEAPDAASWIVPGAEAPPEDPRVAAVFGPIRGSGPTLRLPLAAILPGVRRRTARAPPGRHHLHPGRRHPRPADRAPRARAAGGRDRPGATTSR